MMLSATAGRFIGWQLRTVCALHESCSAHLLEAVEKV